MFLFLFWCLFPLNWYLFSRLFMIFISKAVFLSLLVYHVQRTTAVSPTRATKFGYILALITRYKIKTFSCTFHQLRIFPRFVSYICAVCHRLHDFPHLNISWFPELSLTEFNILIMMMMMTMIIIIKIITVTITMTKMMTTTRITMMIKIIVL